MASMQTALGNTAYVLDHNKKRLLILFIVVGGAIGLYGIRGVFQGILDLIGQAPQLLVLLLFYSFMMVVQFGVLMWFMSRIPWNLPLPPCGSGYDKTRARGITFPPLLKRGVLDA